MGFPLPWNLANQLTLFKTLCEDYAPQTTASTHGFKKLSTPLELVREFLDSTLKKDMKFEMIFQHYILTKFQATF